jgi:hypothetical protein
MPPSNCTTGVPGPTANGTAQSYNVTGLSVNNTYYFAIKTADEVPNWSAVSNSPSAALFVPAAPEFHIFTQQGAGSADGRTSL